MWKLFIHQLKYSGFTSKFKLTPTLLKHGHYVNSKKNPSVSWAIKEVNLMRLFTEKTN